MDGIEFCRLLKEDLKISHIPFILLTAKDTSDSKFQSLGSGADYFFSKPVNVDLLYLTIVNLFNQREKLRQKYLKNYRMEMRELVHSDIDQRFMEQLLAIIEDRISEPDLDVDYICRALAMNRMKLNAKIKGITGQTVNEFVRTVRLKKAVDLMTHEDVSVTEVMYRVGISSQSYFTSAFKKVYGIVPSKFRQDMEEKR